MSSTAQIDANQKNAQQSTGPRTNDGKAASSQNANTHSLAGNFRVLPHEDQPAFDGLLASYLNEWKPRSPDENFLVEQMAQSRWKLARINRIEAEVVGQLCGVQNEPKSADAILAAHILSRNADAYGTLHRYSAAAERTYHRCRTELVRNRVAEAKFAAQSNALRTQIQKSSEKAAAQAAERAAELAKLRNEPKSLSGGRQPGQKPTPGVPFTDEDPLCWRL